MGREDVAAGKAKQVKGKITILPAKKVSPEEALQLLQSALALRGYALVSEKGVVRVVPAAQAAALAKYTVEVVPLNYARAEEVAYTLAALAPRSGESVWRQSTSGAVGR